MLIFKYYTIRIEFLNIKTFKKVLTIKNTFDIIHTESEVKQMKIYSVYWLKRGTFGEDYPMNEQIIVAQNEEEAEKMYRDYVRVDYKKLHANRKVYVKELKLSKSGILTIESFDDIMMRQYRRK